MTENYHLNVCSFQESFKVIIDGIQLNHLALMNEPGRKIFYAEIVAHRIIRLFGVDCARDRVTEIDPSDQ